MGAIVQLVITAERDDLGEAVGEQMLALNLRWWDDGVETCERVLAWLRNGGNGEDGVLPGPAGGAGGRAPA